MPRNSGTSAIHKFRGGTLLEAVRIGGVTLSVLALLLGFLQAPFDHIHPEDLDHPMTSGPVHVHGHNASTGHGPFIAPRTDDDDEIDGNDDYDDNNDYDYQNYVKGNFFNNFILFYFFFSQRNNKKKELFFKLYIIYIYFNSNKVLFIYLYY